jgi:TetR/AcrR family transcriptional repressor of mexJK operon
MRTVPFGSTARLARLESYSSFLYRKPMAKAKNIAPHPKKGRAEALTDHLLDVAAKYFLEKGFAGASVTQIARSAHASKETFYSRYATKEELFCAVIRRQTDTMAVELSSVLAPHALPETALMSFGEIMLDRLLAEETIALNRTISMEWQRFPELAKIFYELGPGRTIASLSKYLDEQSSKGKLLKLNAKLAAQQFMDLLVSEMVMRGSLGIFPKPTKTEKRKKVEDTVTLFLRGYGV